MGSSGASARFGQPRLGIIGRRYPSATTVATEGHTSHEPRGESLTDTFYDIAIAGGRDEASESGSALG
jgi:hypothetical protein